MNGKNEGRGLAIAALVTAMALQYAVRDYFPEELRGTMTWVLLAMEAPLVLFLATNNASLANRPGHWESRAKFALLGLITAYNVASIALLAYHVLSEHDEAFSATKLLGTGAAIFLTNVIVFGIWYWELDRGGPYYRAQGRQHPKYFSFPQDSDKRDAGAHWVPTIVDYLYVSYTNVVAFSPTDTMPIARRAKVMMTLQSMVALTTLVLVFARAVNIIGLNR